MLGIHLEEPVKVVRPNMGPIDVHSPSGCGLVLRWSIVQELDGIEETKAACGTERIRYKYILQRGSNSQTPTGQGSEGGSRWNSQRQGRQTK